MKAGTTDRLVIHLGMTKPFDSVIFTLASSSNSSEYTITKTTSDGEAGIFLIDLTQEMTLNLAGNQVNLEAQINYTDKSVAKTQISTFYINDTLATKLIEGNKPSDDTEGINIILEMIKGDIALVISPKSSEELINAVTKLFNETKQIAQTVRADADTGKFNGDDGKSAYEIAVKGGYEGTETQWIASLKGEPGKPGEPGEKGEPGKPGADGKPGAVPLYNAKNEYVEFVSENDYEKITEAKIEELIGDYVGGSND